jgi:dTDP-D-glucose 4,6-dehydratase
MILFTGGAVLIGSNFLLDWLETTRPLSISTN